MNVDAVILHMIPPIEWKKCVVDWNDPFGTHVENFRPFPPRGRIIRHPVTPGVSYIHKCLAVPSSNHQN